MLYTEKAARVFKVLSVETRVRMVELLKNRSLCVNTLAGTLNISPTAVSQHLRIMRDADVVTADKQGYFVHYRLNMDTLADWNETVKHIFEMNK
ncbi:MAG: metalloregulator ArsR/SmtB family transcription factor [Desulfosarcina sp.]